MLYNSLVTVVLFYHTLVGQYHSVGELGLMVTKLYPSERSQRHFYQKIHDVGCQVYDVVKESDEIPIIELCFTIWQYLHCVLFQGKAPEMHGWPVTQSHKYTKHHAALDLGQIFL